MKARETTRQIFPPPEDEQRIREAVVAEATSWLRTPFHSGGRVKGAGVDCATLIYECYKRAGVDFGSLELSHYSVQWHMHSREEFYLNSIRLFAGEVPGPPERKPKPADVLLCRCANIGYVFNHSAIVIEWPMLIQVLDNRMVTWANAEVDRELKNVAMKFFSLW